jgi:spore maturation protein CgeB
MIVLKNFDLIDKIHYYLDHDDERQQIAAAAYRRVMRDYRIKGLLHRAADTILKVRS